MVNRQKVCIIGSGNWGSAIAKIVGANAKSNDLFEDRVTMYVYEEMIDGKKLTEIINETHENVKYLPGHKIPENVVAVPNVIEAAKDADILIFVIPHQFIRGICSTLLGKIKPNAYGLSLIKGFDKKEGGGIELISHIISRELHIPVSVLMGANLAAEVADEKFCETTIGCKEKNMAPIFKALIQTSYFRVVVVEDCDSVECCGALKNIVACGAGFVEGLELGDNTKAAVIRLGLMEIIKFVEVFFPGGKLGTFFESCGVADLITTCYGGRNCKVSKAFVKTGKTIEELEKEMLNGQKLQGPFTAEEVNYMLKAKNMEDRFPLFTAIHRICIGELEPSALIDCIRCHPEHMMSPSERFESNQSIMMLGSPETDTQIQNPSNTNSVIVDEKMLSAMKEDNFTQQENRKGKSCDILFQQLVTIMENSASNLTQMEDFNSLNQNLETTSKNAESCSDRVKTSARSQNLINTKEVRTNEKELCAKEQQQVKSTQQKKKRRRYFQPKFWKEVNEERSFLNNMILGRKVDSPTLEVLIGLTAINKLVEATIKDLNANGVGTSSEDYITLEQATIFQVKIKVAYARSASKIELMRNPILEKISFRFSRVIKCIKWYIDHIGNFVIDGQLFTPKLIVTDQLACVITPYEVSTNSDISGIGKSYNNLITRIERKYKTALCTVNLTKPSGSAAQLVGSCHISKGIDCIKTWCAKKVPMEILALGGAFRYGYMSECPIHAQEILCCYCEMDCREFFHKLQHLNRKK